MRTNNVATGKLNCCHPYRYQFDFRKSEITKERHLLRTLFTPLMSTTRHSTQQIVQNRVPPAGSDSITYTARIAIWASEQTIVMTQLLRTIEKKIVKTMIKKLPIRIIRKDPKYRRVFGNRSFCNIERTYAEQPRIEAIVSIVRRLPIVKLMANFTGRKRSQEWTDKNELTVGMPIKQAMKKKRRARNPNIAVSLNRSLL